MLSQGIFPRCLNYKTHCSKVSKLQEDFFKVCKLQEDFFIGV